ncbi:hypothetical protein RJ55_03947 [Drechmeria coniospora]|nr:hypothetical protein RJ55_03947 [Drechmeria coniospora]
MDFVRFRSLPTEIREVIWLLSLPADEPEVCLMWPVNLFEREEGPASMRPSRPFIVDTAFPAMMHVCHESRVLAQDSKRSRVRFRWSIAAACPVPFRHYRPDLDTMYFGAENLHPILRSSDLDDQLSDVKSVAFDIHECLRHEIHVIDFIRQEFGSLQTLSFVLADSTGEKKIDDFGRPECVAFRQPSRWCKLQQIPQEMMDTTRFYPNFPVRGRNPVSLLDFLHYFRTKLEASALEGRRLASAIQGTDRSHVVADEENFLWHGPNLKIQAQTFVEYQKDGSWKEVCGDRQFVASLDTVMSGRYVPMAKRLNPERCRVNDLDGDFELIYLTASDDYDDDDDDMY